jgi:GNAT superfamily N-acetyltransferase
VARPIDAGLDVRQATIDEIIALRHAELRPGRPLATAVFEGDDAPTTLHVAAIRQGAVIGCATFVETAPGPSGAYQLRGMATRSDLLGRGIGRQVLAFGQTALVARAPTVGLWCNARVGAIGFYERLGWRVTSDEFEVPDVGPHRRMERSAA